MAKIEREEGKRGKEGTVFWVIILIWCCFVISHSRIGENSSIWLKLVSPPKKKSITVMSGSYWTSTQRLKWQHSKASLARERQKLWILESQLFPQGLSIVMTTKSKDAQGTVLTTTKNIPIMHRDLHYDKDYNLRIYCYFLIMKLGRRLNIRQITLATAHIYLSRFLLKASVREVNLYLLVTTCVYLACKVEECPQYIRNLVTEARSLWPEFVPPDPTKVTEFEFYLIEELQSYLIVHNPYKSMLQITKVLKEPPYNINFFNEDIQNCWSLINDSYINDVHLIYPPHIIAMACMFITVSIQNGKSVDSLKQQDASAELTPTQESFNRFIAESQVDLEELMDTIQQQITLYDHWDKYHEPWIKFLLHTLYLQPQAATPKLGNNSATPSSGNSVTGSTTPSLANPMHQGTVSNGPTVSGVTANGNLKAGT
ncbi:cyclin-dependent protein serine/threonine kinase regulator SSN8 KNAG_0H01960 [Huiozyma naganishii CBS 8797]|uniref:RNA polymerase II holoenzyme cyclin-like subunit n=1 Tax=Huiozyma naganishii (strain ATCC MYA-139 / BCRC 22969 / CBS 8797 / KCTC 17520 / NBRC 10181 / NCYC 3082 / Yp74L-3) TaxID=1071383 RepID=J7R9R7_HUIN7|nr:hypothetical protein KNAG_0H01960 [Kazachstania naganishii CBS 8797]CCK71610.1 hypothetical protein KNAG_0H01960 [Kazachstania naganishii CBS 8797]